MPKARKNTTILSVVVFSLALFLLPAVVRVAAASSADELRAKIDEKNKAIQALEDEIAEHQKQVDSLSGQTKSLKNTLSALDAERKKFLAQIKVTETRISSANLNIEELSTGIASKEDSIRRDVESLSALVRTMDSMESDTLVEVVLGKKNLSAVSDSIDSLSRVNERIQSKLADLKSSKIVLENNKLQNEKKKKELEKLRAELSDRKKIVEINQAEKDRLLKQTMNKEANFRTILKQKSDLRDAFERELLSFESELKFAIDPTSLPTAGTGVLKWPVDAVKITQYFGKTDFATKNPQVYNGLGHNGIDLRAPIGTQIKAAASGKIIGVGDTDKVCPGASYGKWILIEHDNGLSTLYSHFSLIKVANGQDIDVGEVIGYSGDTGYATGPHLHFAVFASQGVRVMSQKSKVCGGTYTLPLADFRAYLNPLSYL